MAFIVCGSFIMIRRAQPHDLRRFLGGIVGGDHDHIQRNMLYPAFPSVYITILLSTEFFNPLAC